MDIFSTPETRKKYLETYYEPAMAQWPVPYESLRAVTQYGNTHVLCCGRKAGPPLFLTNGIGDDILYWRETLLLKRLAGYFQVFLPDRIGDPGKSEMKKPIASADDYACWMKELLAALGIERTQFLGIHQGGWEALFYSISLPEQTRKVICANPGGGIRQMRLGAAISMFGSAGSREKLKRYARSISAPSFAADDAVQEKSVEKFLYISRNSRPSFIMPRKFSNGELAAIQCPLLLLLSGHNPWYDNRKAARRAERRIKNAIIRVVENAGLNVFSEQPEAAARAAIEFLQG